ncbi:hypothetical protein [Neisseria gonorrhoeae]|uniref:hypothetical protein n=1 Tax=Neisseria gonorrhoeae TaxID=485 RepID=UPI0021DB1CF7|nr:hypothetical protein [Neisseria gonorrhoeae]UXY73218.1 hypothetical protein OCL42_08575 [Neisseria gonorrhoeae]
MRGTRRIRGEKRFARRVDGLPACRKLEAADEMAAYAETLRRGAMRDARWKNASGVRASPRFQKLPD